MILISAGLVLAAVVLLIAGFVLAKPFLIMWSIVVSVLSALFLVIGAFLRRHELFPGGGRAAAPATPPPTGLMPPPPGSPYNQTGPVAHQPPPQTRPQPQPPQRTVTLPATGPRRPPAGGVAPDAIVLVIPGRKRYHVAGCRQLAGREHEELTYEEAREEGFTPCTACLPDAALGGRQLPPAADPDAAAAPGSALAAESRAEPPAEPRTPSTPRPGPQPASGPQPSNGPQASTGPQSVTGPRSAADAQSATGPRSPSGSQPSSGPHAATGPRPAEGVRPGDASQSGTRPAARQEPAGVEPEGSKSGDRPEPAAAREEGAAGWFGRPAAASAGQAAAKGPSAPGAGSEDEQGETQTSIFRPPPYASRPQPTPPGKGSRSGDEPGPRPEGKKPGTPSAETTASGTGAASEAAGKSGKSGATPGKPAATPGEPVDASGKPAERSGKPAATSGKSAATSGEPAGASGKPAAASGKPVDASAKPAATPGKSVAGKSATSGGASGSEAKGGAPAEADAERTDPSLRRPGKGDAATPGRPEGAGRAGQQSAGDEDDDAGPSTAPQPRITVAPKERTERAQESSAASRTTVFPVAGQEKSEGGKKAQGKSGEEPPEQGASTVKVIAGTRRYHGADCPLIKGAGDSSVETMTVAAAKAAGLTICPICRHDRETVS
ncbi:hypothetical protein ACFYUK_02440 [Nonomuraea wenchangensis]